MVRKRIVRTEESLCVWKLECPYCGWLFGFCLDVTDLAVPANAVFLVDGKVRKPTGFPKYEGDRTYAYFKVRRRKCCKCDALCIREDDFSLWLKDKYFRATVEFEDLVDLLVSVDPSGRCAIASSDRVYDARFQEWGTDDMPTRYLFVRNQKELAKRLRSLA
jgi:hypothetical protein